MEIIFRSDLKTTVTRSLCVFSYGCFKLIRNFKIIFTKRQRARKQFYYYPKNFINFFFNYRRKRKENLYSPSTCAIIYPKLAGTAKYERNFSDKGLRIVIEEVSKWRTRKSEDMRSFFATYSDNIRLYLYI